MISQLAPGVGPAQDLAVRLEHSGAVLLPTQDLLATQDAPWYAVRPATPAELPGVMESWSGTWKRSRYAGCIPNHLFEQITFTAITQLLQRGAKVDVLTARSAPGVVLGWVCHEADRRSSQRIVHYLFVKDGFRERGYGGLLLASIGIQRGDRFIYTHKTPFEKYFKGGHWNPGIARRKSI